MLILLLLKQIEREIKFHKNSQKKILILHKKSENKITLKFMKMDKRGQNNGKSNYHFYFFEKVKKEKKMLKNRIVGADSY